MSGFEFIFLADCQLGAYATFSGMTEADIDRFVERGMTVDIVPRTEGFEWDADRYREAIGAVNQIRPDFVVMGGDMIDDLRSQDQYDALMSITSELDDSIEMRWVPGNHDVAFDTVTPTHESIAAYRDAFGPDYYSFDHGDIRFIALNTVVIDHPESSDDEFGEQMEFVRWEVDRLVEEARRGVFFGHHPLFVSSADEDDTYWNLPLTRRLTLLEEFRRGGITHAFAGHWHRNSIARHEDFEMVTSGPVGYPLGADPSGIRRVFVEPDQITHTYHGLDEFGGLRTR
jgi:3',5'-cyclic AMP phosphodiesterase CpdA